MKRRVNLLVIGVVIMGTAVSGCTQRQEHAHNESAAQSPQAQSKSIPAHYETEPPRSSLAPTLAPEKFTGKTQEAYRVVRETPQLIAQLPCYCYCDRGFGHKSLHSCFVDDHAAHCAVCIDEALLAYNLQKRGLSPQQIREQIIAQYGG